MKLLGLAGWAFAVAVCALPPTEAAEDVCEADDACDAESHGSESSSLVQLARQGVGRSNETDSATPGCPAVPGAKFGFVKIGKFEFVNNCHEDIVLSGWDCVVPAGGSCTVGHTCHGHATYNAKPLCSAVSPTWKPRGSQTALKWCLAGLPNSCSMIEMNVAWPGEGYCLQRMNGQMHIGFTTSWRAELFLSGTQTPACRDYGMEQAVGDATPNGNTWNCPAGTVPLGSPGIHPKCNTYACYCTGEYLKRGCQVVTECKHIYDNMWTMIYDEGAKRQYKCKGFCAAARHGVPHAKGCGWVGSQRFLFGKPEVSNYWYSDDGGQGNPKALSAHWAGGGILGDWTAKKRLDPLKQTADFRVTSCGIQKTHSPDPKCCCGAPEAPGIGCSGAYSPC